MKDGASPLMKASRAGQTAIVRELLRVGSDVNVIDEVGICLSCYISFVFYLSIIFLV